MIVIGFNLPLGKAIRRPGEKEERPARIMGLGIGWSRADFTRVMKRPTETKRPERHHEP